MHRALETELNYISIRRPRPAEVDRYGTQRWCLLRKFSRNIILELHDVRVYQPVSILVLSHLTTGGRARNGSGNSEKAHSQERAFFIEKGFP